MSTLLELAERCEQATGPDRELGLEVMKACGWQEVVAFGYSWLRPDGTPLSRTHVPDPTASLDAAMALVPEGCRPVRLYIESEATAAFIGKVEVAALTPALALCAAALRAHHAIADRSPEGRDKGTLGSVHESGGAQSAIAPPKGAA